MIRIVKLLYILFYPFRKKKVNNRKKKPNKYIYTTW